MMPYMPFSNQQKFHYDLDLLARRFDTSLEQVCHRRATEYPTYARHTVLFVRGDDAGNISKRRLQLVCICHTWQHLRNGRSKSVPHA